MRSLPAQSGAAEMAQRLNDRAFLDGVDARNANREHIRIAPMVGSATGGMQSILVEVPQHAIPIGVAWLENVAGAPPCVAQLRRPRPSQFASPVADVEEDRSGVWRWHRASGCRVVPP